MEKNEKKDLALNISASVIEELGGKPLVIELHNTEHNAPTLNEKIVFTKHVTLSSIDEWIKKRDFVKPVNKNVALITYCVNPNNPSVKFQEDPNDKLATVLTSKLKMNPDFLAFGINSQDHFSQKQLENLIRTKAHCFQNLQDAKDLIKKLQNFQVRYEQTVTKSDDRQGNTNDAVTTAIKAHAGEISGELKLAMPLFLGTEKVGFTVEIEIERGSGNMPEFGFYSLDVQMLVMESASNAILTEVEKFKDSFVCLEIEE